MPNLWIECDHCRGTGSAVDPPLDGWPCLSCRVLRVRAAGLTTELTESMARDLSRARLRLVTLERELRDTQAELDSSRGFGVPVVLEAGAAAEWWLRASPTEQVRFTTLTGLRLGAGGYLHVLPRKEDPPSHTKEGD